MRSAAVERAVTILDFLAAHPGEQFTMSELARRLDISKATMHGLLSTLVGKGYLVRITRTGTYGLGPALVPLGSVAETTLPALVEARAQLRIIVEGFDVEASISCATASEILVVAHEGVPKPFGITGRAAQRLPLIPPFGTIFMAWEDPARVAEWLRRIGPDASADELARCERALHIVRRRGWAYAARTDALLRLSEIYEGGEDIHTARSRAMLSDVLHDLAQTSYLEDGGEPPDELPLYYVSAPIFGPDGSMPFALNIVPGDGYSTHDLPALVQALRRSAAAAMDASHGRAPHTARSQSEPRPVRR